MTKLNYEILWTIQDHLSTKTKKNYLLETAFLYFETIREIEIENEKFGGKKVSSVFTQYVYFLCVCVFVCLSSSLYRLLPLT